MIHIISSNQAHSLLEQGAQFVDVRTVAEFNDGCLPGAQNLPIKTIENVVNQLDKKKPLIVYCRTGGRSAKAQVILEKAGFQSVHNIGSMANFKSD